MATKFFIIILSSLMLSCDGWSQQNEFEDELKTYLISTGELGSDGKGTVYIANLLDGEKYGGKDGIYRFVVLGSHKLPCFAYRLDGKAFILKEYRMDDVLDWYQKYLKSEVSYTPVEKATVLENIGRILKQRETIIEELSISDDIDY